MKCPGSPWVIGGIARIKGKDLPMCRAVVHNGWGVGIGGIGAAVPHRIVTNHELEQSLDTTDEWIKSRTGISERRVLDKGETACELAVKASQAALADGGVSAVDIDLIVAATITPDTPMPSTACRLQHALGCKRAGAFDLSIACSGFAYAVSVASQFIRSGSIRLALVIGVEALSTVVDWTERTTAVLFGDAAGAVLLREVPASEGILVADLGASGEHGSLLVIPAGGSKLPGRTPGLSPADFCIQMDGRGVYRLAVDKMVESSLKVLDKAGIPPAEVDLFVPHQANARIMESVGRRLGIPQERVFMNLERYGNTSSASVPVALAEAYSQGVLKPGMLVLVSTFGGGIAWGSFLMRWT